MPHEKVFHLLILQKVERTTLFSGKIMKTNLNLNMGKVEVALDVLEVTVALARWLGARFSWQCNVFREQTCLPQMEPARP